MKQYNEKIRGKLFNYFDQRLTLKRSTRGFYRCNCVHCSGKSTMGISLTRYKVHCFKCGVQENPIQLLMDIEGFTEFGQAISFLKIQQEYDAYKDYVEKKIELRPVELPPSYTLISDVDCYMGKCARHYLKGRGFRLSYLESRGVGYCTSGEYMGYIIFPVYQGDKLVFFQGRKFIDLGPKMKNPPLEQFGIGKNKIFYNGDALFLFNSVYIVESITNSLTLGDWGVASLGKSLSQYQINCLIKSPTTHITIILDPDAYGDAILLAMQLVQFKKVRVIKLPDDKDVNELGKKKTMEFVRAQPWQTYSDLLRIKINLNGKGSVYTHNRERLGISPSRGF